MDGPVPTRTAAFAPTAAGPLAEAPPNGADAAIEVAGTSVRWRPRGPLAAPEAARCQSVFPTRLTGSQPPTAINDALDELAVAGRFCSPDPTGSEYKYGDKNTYQ